MRKYKALLSSFLFCLAGWVAYGQNPSWKVEIKLAQTVIKSDEDFFVFTVVRNTGKGEQSLYVWPCTYPLWWNADNPRIQVNGVACLQNSLATIRLKPGDAYERLVPVHVDLPADSTRRESVTFRLRYEFANSLATFAPGMEIPTIEIPPIWSNPVTIEVTRQSTPDGFKEKSGGITVEHYCGTTYHLYRSSSPLALLTNAQIAAAASKLVYDRANQTSSGTVTIKNISNSTISGPLQVVLDSLTSGVVITDATGSFGCRPYITVADMSSLEPGQSVTFPVQFSNPTDEVINYVPMVYSGSIE